MSVACIIVAAGRGTRAGADIPKQYVDIAGKPILEHTIRAIAASALVDAIQVVIHPEDETRFEGLAAGLDGISLLPCVHGGDTRTASVLAGLQALSAIAPSTVLVHDAARPFVGISEIEDVITATLANRGAFLAVPVVDALWRGEGTLTSVERDNLWRAQTPQAFPYPALLAAYDAFNGDAADDVAVAQDVGLDVIPIQGSDDNFKITRPEDFDRAEKLLKEREADLDIRTGNAFDVHAFGEGDRVVLNGVSIPHSKTLKGHSDADVAMHALTDAIFGALCEGDIGQWFPPSDPQWKGAASEIFLRKAVERASERGFQISHLDCTIICEAPKIGPHSDAMRDRLSEICSTDRDRISVKATTSERLGFTGREEGIAALASATLVKP
ncbi:MAG: bifunctional 2-C-methyl-D-erythritol 4-phosphate cytidylyltransferase/2-C-methyl-D-erythritol 2,4-cyclodiphosphate synthase [Pseudomonadota bacterium]